MRKRLRKGEKGSPDQTGIPAAMCHEFDEEQYSPSAILTAIFSAWLDPEPNASPEVPGCPNRTSGLRCSRLC